MQGRREEERGSLQEDGTQKVRMGPTEVGVLPLQRWLHINLVKSADPDSVIHFSVTQFPHLAKEKVSSSSPGGGLAVGLCPISLLS